MTARRSAIAVRQTSCAYKVGGGPAAFVIEVPAAGAYRFEVLRSIPDDITNRISIVKDCALRGAEIPTEAQLEFVGTGRRSAPYVWGRDPPQCGDAVFGRAKDASFSGPSSACAALGSGSARAGTGKRDVLHLPTGDVFDLAGNVAELASDFYQLPGEPCLAPGLYRDPFCETPTPRLASDASGRTVRGGNWMSPPQFMKAAFSRDPDTDYRLGKAVAPVGFRCVRKATAR